MTNIIPFTAKPEPAYAATPAGNIEDLIHASTFTTDEVPYIAKRLAEYAERLAREGKPAAARRAERHREDLYGALADALFTKYERTRP